MPIQMFFKAKRLNTSVGLKIFWTLFLMALLCFSSVAFAGTPIGGKAGIDVYNVGVGSFSVVWQVDVDSNCSVRLFSDINGDTPVPAGNYTVYSGQTPSQQLGLTRGVMQVDVKGLPPAVTIYYIQTVSTHGTEEFLFPAFGDLIPVETEPAFTATQPFNNFVYLLLYDENGINASDYQENMITDGAVTIVYAKTTDGTEQANYPIAAFNSTTGLDNGFPQSSTEGRVEIYLGDFRKGKAEAGNYWDWPTDKDFTLTIKSYGGAVPGVGLGQTIITTTYPGSWKYAAVGCLANTDGCTEVNTLNFSQIILRPNQGPVVPSIPDQNVNKGNLLSVDFCASDPEGDAVVSFALTQSPAGMVLTPDAADANCATITWTPSECGSDENIQFTVTDDQGSTSTNSFTVSIKRCPPYQPGASIAPAAPVTNQNLTCTAVSNGDPDGDTISFIYAWYDVASPANILSTTDTLNSSATAKDKSYACSVIAHDTDGDSEPFIASPVTVLNSPPAAPGSAVVSPDEPPTDQDLTCTITASTDLDNDPLQYIYVWSCGTCGTASVEHGPQSGLTDTLDSSNTAKGENWSCEVRATDGTAQSSAITSNSVSIANLPPSDPGGVQITPASNVKTGNDLTCSIGSTSTDPDGDPVKYVFTWDCDGSGCGAQTSIERAPKEGTSDILASNDTAKDQTWSCSVWAQDDFGAKSATIQSANSVVVENSPPVGLTVQVSPDPAYVNDNLTCTASGVTDGDGDAISYKYVWKKDGAVVAALTKDFTEGKTTDTIQADNTSQGETWACEVTAKDTSDVEVGPISDDVSIENRPPVITTAPDADPHIWDEEQTYTIEVQVSDPDGNEFTLEMDTNYIHPGDPNVSDWLEFNPNNNTLTATPPFGSSAVDFGYGTGMLELNFIVEETDGTPNNRVEKPVTVMIRFPAITIDDFEYPADKPTLAANGWYRLQGSGSMSLKQEDTNDPNSNHYLKTSVSGTPTNNSQLGYIVYKNIPAGSEFDNEYPAIMFSVKDINLYYFDVFVKGKNSAGQEENFFLRYIPQDPAGTIKKSGNYVIKNIGKESIDPNSDVVIEVESNMDTDLFAATDFHYLYMKGIVLRGDIDFIDDIKVRSAPPPGLPKDVLNLAAVGNENQATLEWTLPANQVENIAGYRIYMDANDPPAKEEAFRIATVTKDKTSYTKTGLANGVTYCFRVTAIDNLLTPNETAGKTVCATPEVTIPLAPVDVTAESMDSTIQLTWKNPPGQHPDLAGYVIYYCDCASGDCSLCYAAPLVIPSMADANGVYTQYITKDANQDFLQYGTTYSFTVKAEDTAQPANLSAGKKASITLTYPATKIIDNFDKDYQSGQTLMSNGWYRLQGKGQFNRKILIANNNYLEVKSNYTGTSALDYNIVKWLQNPDDFTNPYFAARIRSLGNFELVVYLKGMDGNNYFLGYKADATAEEDSNTAVKVANRNYVYTLGWKNKASSTEWYEVERNLDDDLMAAKGTGFKMLMGVILSGTLDIDDMEVGEGVLEAENLTARPGDSSVSLSWTIADPNKIDETKIYINDNNTPEDTITVTSDKNDYQYEVTGLTNDTSYTFKLIQVAGEDESKGVSVTATPMQYKTSFTFDDQAAVDEWTLQVSAGVTLSSEYDSGVQSNVMYLNPSGDYPDRYYAYMDNMNVSDVTGMTCRIRTSSNFVIWVHLEDTLGIPFMLGFVPGSTAGNHSRFGNFGYYFLGPDLTDGKWHSFDLKLDDVMGSIFTDPPVGANKIMGIYFGGRIYVDDVSTY